MEIKDNKVIKKLQDNKIINIFLKISNWSSYNKPTNHHS
jgi:hypothetical protein